MKRIEVELNVTQGNIYDGVACSVNKCPIGLSLSNYEEVIVHDYVIRLHCDGIWYEYNIPKEGDIQQFIQDFDDGKWYEVEPFKTKPLDFIEVDLSYKSSEDI